MPKKKLEELLEKYNICIRWYFEQIEDTEKTEKKLLETNSKYADILNYMKKTLSEEDSNKIVFQYVKAKLGNFSTTFDTDVMSNIDDFKIVYFIALYFMQEDNNTKEKEELRVLFLALHKLMSNLLITQEPKIILNKFDGFFRRKNWEKFKEEYGDVGYYHTMKSIYLMQVTTIKELVKTEKIVIEDTFISKYFTNHKSCT